MPKNSSKSVKAVIFGCDLKKARFWQKAKPRNMQTPYGRVDFRRLNDCVFIMRHGIKRNIPPRRINHKANMFSLKKIGAGNVFAFNSVGSLKKEIKPGNFAVASDYIHFDPPTFYENKANFAIPSLSVELRKALMNVLISLKMPFKKEAVYFQTKGPRFETKAEINLIKNFADVVGMTMASEASLASELGLEYASLCSVDNYANGIVKKPLIIEDFWANQAKIAVKIEGIIEELLKIRIK